MYNKYLTGLMKHNAHICALLVSCRSLFNCDTVDSQSGRVVKIPLGLELVSQDHEAFRLVLTSTDRLEGQ